MAIEYSPEEARTIFAFTAREDTGLIVAIGHSKELKRRLAAIKREAVKGIHDPLPLLLNYCAEKNLLWEFHELATYTCDKFNADWYKYRWYEAAMIAGLNPKFIYSEEKSRENVERIIAGEPYWLPEWPKHLLPQKPFVNPFYEHFTSKTFVATPKPAPEQVASSWQDYEAATARYVDYLFDQAQSITHLANAQAEGRNLFVPLPHLGHAVTAMERKGIATDIGDRWIETDIKNRRTALGLLAISFDYKLISVGMSDDNLPPYTHAGIGLKLYENRNRRLPVEKWKERIQDMMAQDMGYPERRTRPDSLAKQWAQATQERLKKLGL